MESKSINVRVALLCEVCIRTIVCRFACAQTEPAYNINTITNISNQSTNTHTLSTDTRHKSIRLAWKYEEATVMLPAKTQWLKNTNKAH